MAIVDALSAPRVSDAVARVYLGMEPAESVGRCFDCGGRQVAIDAHLPGSLNTFKVAYCSKCGRTSDCLDEPDGA
jgi:hypothetical protein